MPTMPIFRPIWPVGRHPSVRVDKARILAGLARSKSLRKRRQNQLIRKNVGHLVLLENPQEAFVAEDNVKQYIWLIKSRKPGEYHFSHAGRGKGEGQRIT